MAFCAERGSGFAVLAVAIRGAAAARIQFRLKVGGAFVPRQSRRKGRSHIPITWFVNSPAGNDYGSPSLGRHYRLRHRPDRLVRLHGVAFTATAAGADRRIPDAG